MKGIRSERVAEEIREEISEILQNRISDRRIGLVAVTRVEVSRDFTHAKVYVSVFGDESAQETSLRVLIGARGFIRSELGRRIRAKRIPDLEFRADHGIQYSMRIQEVLRDLGLGGAPPGPESSRDGADDPESSRDDEADDPEASRDDQADDREASRDDQAAGPEASPDDPSGEDAGRA